MAIRPVFMVDTNQPYFARKNIEFIYYPGFSISQKQKSIISLHDTFLKQNPNNRILEVSSKSKDAIGRDLSAFNLKFSLENGDTVSVESAFQSSKIFENGMQYVDLLYRQPYEAKKDIRLKNSGDIIGFKFQEEDFPIEPKTLFYNWIYINALNQNDNLGKEIINYTAFTDIEYNPNKSINCQAMSVAMYASLVKGNVLNEALKNVDSFRKIVYPGNDMYEQISLF